eukprot:6172135-Pleurochrysis_carterae.AAC.2
MPRMTSRARAHAHAHVHLCTLAHVHARARASAFLALLLRLVAEAVRSLLTRGAHALEAFARRPRDLGRRDGGAVGAWPSLAASREACTAERGCEARAHARRRRSRTSAGHTHARRGPARGRLPHQAEGRVGRWRRAPSVRDRGLEQPRCRASTPPGHTRGATLPMPLLPTLWLLPTRALRLRLRRLLGASGGA